MAPSTAPREHPPTKADNTASLREQWALLHAGDTEPLPHDPAVLAGWSLFHQGRLADAFEAGLRAARGNAPAGLFLANKAQLVHAHYLERSEVTRQALYLEVAERAEHRCAEAPREAAAWYASAYALGQYSRSISVTAALARGLGTRVRAALERAIELAPRHADAHFALGAFHAEVIDKVGLRLGRTQGAGRQAGLRCFETGLRLNPRAVFGRIEYARGLLMLEGIERMADANRLYEAAAAVEPLDAVEALEVAIARAELTD